MLIEHHLMGRVVGFHEIYVLEKQQFSSIEILSSWCY